MKAIIIGSSGTPYAHGAFVYDIYFDANYPNGPPKVILTTTGGGSIRFNPNLYAEGKVCLSILGTWRGTATENWNPKVSTLLQVLLSIQAIIMSNEVYFNEPGYEHEMNTHQGDLYNRGYSNIVRWGNLKYAILEQLRKPEKGFEDIIRRNFFLKKDMILAEIDQWIEAGKEEASYQGLVHSHNYNICNKFSADEDLYYNDLVSMRKELVEEFAKLDSPFMESPTLLKRESSQDSGKKLVTVKVGLSKQSSQVTDQDKQEN
jgi:ubiquitin-protein ligase